MLWFQSLLIALPLYTVVLARALGTRQNDRLDIDRYISRVQTALQVINNISAGNASESCSDPDFPTRFEEAGYDGQYAQMLLCEEAVGIRVFPNIDRARRGLSAALEGLSSARDLLGVPNRSALCHVVDVDDLENAGLDGEAIRSAICEDVSSFTSASRISSTTETAIRRITTMSSRSSSVPQGPSSRATREDTSSTVTSSSATSSTEFLSSSRSTVSISAMPSSRIPSSSQTSRNSRSQLTERSSSSSTLSETPGSVRTTALLAPSSSPADSVTVIVVTTTITVHVTAGGSPTPNTPALRLPLSFSLESRIVPVSTSSSLVVEPKSIVNPLPWSNDSTPDSASDLPASLSTAASWVVGPPLSFAARMTNDTTTTATQSNAGSAARTSSHCAR